MRGKERNGDAYRIRERGGKEDAEGTLLSVPWLMIRDDTRHSSLSDVRLDCRYCSLSFIFRVCAPRYS